MDKFRYKKWTDVGIAEVIRSHIQKKLSASKVLDMLVLDRVFHNTRKLLYTYFCDECGFSYVCTRTFEDMPYCIRCGSRQIKSTQKYRFNKDKIQPYSRSEEFVDMVIQQMQSNYNAYYGFCDHNFIDFGWKIAPDNSLPTYSSRTREVKNIYCKFASGEMILADTPSHAVAKAAVLTPFLWDDSYNWKEKYSLGKGREVHLTPLFYQMMRVNSGKKKSRLHTFGN